MIKKIINFILSVFGLKLQEENIKKESEGLKVWYTKKKIMTSSEISFYNLLEDVLEDQFIIWPQISLASIINRNNNKYKKQYQNELYHNVDFGIFDKSTFELLLLVELNDESHNRPDRKKRDENVKKICNSCGYKIISFWSSKPNEPNYVKDRVLRWLGSININAESTQELNDILNYKNGL